MSPGSPEFNPVPGLAVIPEHELVSAIASGAYGQVWLARNRLGVYRAVKIVNRSSFDHDRPFKREFAGIKAFEPVSRSHEGLVDLLQVGRDDRAGYFYYVMELADDLNGERTKESAASRTTLQDPKNYSPRTLSSELKRHGRLPLEDCIQIGLALGEGLAHLHRQGLVHRDIKPSNIIFVGGMPKLADVGLVATVTEARSFVGTEGFIPPEGPGTPQADLYSLGIVLYVLSTGNSHQDFPEPPADLSAQADHSLRLELDAVIHRACQVKARERYQTAEEMQKDLASLQRGESVRQKRAASRRWALVKRLGLAAAGMILLLAAILGFKGMNSGNAHHGEAVHFYELGRWHYNQLTATDVAKARDYLYKAIQLDPKFLEPYRELTAYYIWPGDLSDPERLEKMKEIANAVRSIAPDLAEEHTALSLCRFLERDWHGAEAEIVLAIQLNPNLPISHQFYSYYLTSLGRTEEAHRESQKADELSPPDAARISAIVAAWPYIAERRFDLAIAELKRAIELDPNFSQGHNYLGICYDAQSNYLAAIEEFRTSDLLSGQNPVKVAASYDAIREALETQGEQGYSRKWIELTLAERSVPEDQRIFFENDLGAEYARLGENEKALDEIEKHFDDPNFWSKLKYEPLYDTLHDEPRFKALLRRAGLEH